MIFAPPLESIRGIAQFPLGTCSWLHPFKTNNVIRNLEYIAPKVDLIQVLCFSTEYLDDLLNSLVIKTMQTLEKKYSISWVVHLPLDLNLADPNHNNYPKARSILEQIFNQLHHLHVRSWVLHLDRIVLGPNFKMSYPKVGLESTSQVIHTIENLQRDFPSIYPFIAIENTGYDLGIFADCLRANKMGICMDIGHLGILNLDRKQFLDYFALQIIVIHAHGWLGHKDHQGLDCLTESSRSELWKDINNLNVPTVLELFSSKHYNNSVKAIKRL